MKRWSFSPEADADLFEIWMYLLLEADIKIANRLEAEIYEACDLLAERPMVGSLKPEWTNRPVRFRLVGKPERQRYRARISLGWRIAMR